MDYKYSNADIPTAELEKIHGKVTELENYMMALYRIAHLAQQARIAQGQYFKTRSRDDLIESKRIERQLDMTLSQFFHPERA